MAFHFPKLQTNIHITNLQIFNIMELHFINSIKNSIKHWYIPLLVGLLFVIISIVVFRSPLGSLITLAMLFSISFILGGVSEIIFSIVNRKGMHNWGWSLVFGIITLIVGLLLLSNPALSILSLSFYIGFIMMFRSVSAISFAIDLKKFGSKNWIGLLILGILGAIFSILLIWNPVFAGMSVVVLVALSFLFAGLFSIFFSFQLRKLHKMSKEVSPQIRERIIELQEDIRGEWGQ